MNLKAMRAFIAAGFSDKEHYRLLKKTRFLLPPDLKFKGVFVSA